MFTAADTRDVPSSDDLRLLPEMASMHVLHEAVSVTIRSLRAVHQVPPRCIATQALATGIIALLHALDTLLTDYREARCEDLSGLAKLDHDIDDLPF